MAQQTINVGTSPNDGTGTPLRTAFQYTNSNFSELYTAVGPSGNNIVVPGNATITGALAANGDTTLGTASKSTNTNLNFSSDLGTQRVYIDRGTRSLVFYDATSAIENYRIAGITGIHTWGVGGSTAMTLNSTGLGIGVTPVTGYRLSVAGGAVTDGPTKTVMVVRNTNAPTAGVGSGIALSTNVGTFSANLVTIEGVKENATTDNYASALVFSTRANAADLSERLRIDSSGNVGIGVTPSAWGSNYKAFQIGAQSAIYNALGYITSINTNAYENSSGNLVRIANGEGTRYVQVGGAHQWYYAANAIAGTVGGFTQAMTLDASGNLLVGTTTNTENFRSNTQFSGNSTNGLLVKNLASTGAPLLLQLIDSAQSLNNATPSVEYQDSTTQRWRLYKNGGLANYQANNVNLSDARTKTDIKPLGSYWNKIKSLEIVTFKYKDQTHNDDNIGLIAQQVESVAPELVDVDGFGNTPEDGVPLKTIYTTDLYHAAIKALQEAMTRIEALEAKLS